LRFHVDAARFDAITQAAAKGGIPALEKYKDLRVVQLLARP
jgi:hypothetical protein